MVNNRFFIAFIAIVGVLFVTFLTKRTHLESQKMNHVKVYECLEVGDDIASLKKHMQSHQEFVDYFVILEDLQNQTEANSLRYEKSKEQFKELSHKVIYLVTSSLSETNLKEVSDFYVKNQYLKALDNCLAEDVILFSDAKSLIQPQDLKKGVLWLQKHPNQVVKLRAKSTENKNENFEIRAAMYSHVKESLPAFIEKKSKLKAQKISWKSAFFPV